LFTYTFFNYG